MSGCWDFPLRRMAGGKNLELRILDSGLEMGPLSFYIG